MLLSEALFLELKRSLCSIDEGEISMSFISENFSINLNNQSSFAHIKVSIKAPQFHQTAEKLYFMIYVCSQNYKIHAAMI